MRAFVCAFSLFLSTAALGKIVSLDLCADQWVLWLFSAENITAVSPLARTPNLSFEYQKTAEVSLHDNQIESFLQHPKDVYFATYLPHRKKSLLEKAGLKVILLPPIKHRQDFEKIFQIFEKEFAYNNALREKIGVARHFLQHEAASPQKRALTFDVGGYSCGRNTNWSILLEQVDMQNTNTTNGCQYITIEDALLEAPDYILCTGEHPTLPSCTHDAFTESTPCVLPERLILCATPNILDAAEQEIKKCSA